MTMQAPTRITIEVHSPIGDDAATIRVVPEEPAFARAAHAPTAAEPREAGPAPAAYDPGPCLCLDDEDCGADHAND